MFTLANSMYVNGRVDRIKAASNKVITQTFGVRFSQFYVKEEILG